MEGEINGIMWIGVFCAHKPYFLMLGHKYSIHYILIRGIETFFKGSRQIIRSIVQHIHDQAMYGPNVSTRILGYKLILCTTIKMHITRR